MKGKLPCPSKQSRYSVLLVGTLCSSFHQALAQDAAVKPHVPLAKTIGEVTPTGPVPSLAVINSTGATLEGTKLTLTGVSANSIVFADRPVRAAGHVATEQFIMQWDKDKGSFAEDPPNATISISGGDGSKVSDAVVTLKSPKLEGRDLTFDVAVLEGSLLPGQAAWPPCSLIRSQRISAAAVLAASMAAVLAVSMAAMVAFTPARSVGMAAATGTRRSTMAPGIGRALERPLNSPRALRSEQRQRRPTTTRPTMVAVATIPIHVATNKWGDSR